MELRSLPPNHPLHGDEGLPPYVLSRLTRHAGMLPHALSAYAAEFVPCAIAPIVLNPQRSPNPKRKTSGKRQSRRPAARGGRKEKVALAETERRVVVPAASPPAKPNPYLQALLSASSSSASTTTIGHTCKEDALEGSGDGEVGVQPLLTLLAGNAFVTRPANGAYSKLKEKWMNVAKKVADKERSQEQLRQHALETVSRQRAVGQARTAGWHDVLGGSVSIVLSNDVIASSYALPPARLPTAAAKPSSSAMIADNATAAIGEAAVDPGTLFDALVDGSLQDLERLLMESQSRNRFVCSDASSAFHGLDLLSIAVMTNNLGAAKLLLDQSPTGAPKVDFKDRIERRTPLHRACLKGHFDMVKLLLAEGADPRVTDKHGYSCLHLAVIAKSPSTVAHLVGCSRHLKININLRSKAGLTPLMLCRDKEIAACLLGGGADPLAVSPEGLDYYCLLVRSRHSRLLEAVLNCNVNKSRPTSIASAADGAATSNRAQQHLAPLVLACKLNAEDCAEVLMDSYSMSASLSRHFSDCDEEGMTALHYICMHGNTALLRRVLAAHTGHKGAQGLQCESREGATPLALAVAYGHEEAARIVITHEGPACLQRENSSGHTCAEFLLHRHRYVSGDMARERESGLGLGLEGMARMLSLLFRSGLTLRNKTAFLMCRFSCVSISGVDGSGKIRILCTHRVMQQQGGDTGIYTLLAGSSQVSTQGEFSNSQEDCDVILLSSDSRRLYCHSAVLVAASEKMKAYLSFRAFSKGGGSAKVTDAGDGVFLDAPYELLLLLVQYAYSGLHSLLPLFSESVCVAVQDERLLDLLWLADEFIMPQLVHDLEQELCRRLANALQRCRAGQQGGADSSAAETNHRADLYFAAAKTLNLKELKIVSAFVYLNTFYSNDDSDALVDVVESMLE